LAQEVAAKYQAAEQDSEADEQPGADDMALHPVAPSYAVNIMVQPTGSWSRDVALYRRRVLEDPGLDARELMDALRTAYGVEATGFSFVPGSDMHAASYGVATSDGGAFAKLRYGPVATTPLDVPRALLDAGVSNVLAPIRTLTSTLWHPMGDGRTLVLYPFVAG